LSQILRSSGDMAVLCEVIRMLLWQDQGKLWQPWQP